MFLQYVLSVEMIAGWLSRFSHHYPILFGHSFNDAQVGTCWHQFVEADFTAPSPLHSFALSARLFFAKLTATNFFGVILRHRSPRRRRER
jgi:hypothetical protein